MQPLNNFHKILNLKQKASRLRSEISVFLVFLLTSVSLSAESKTTLAVFDFRASSELTQEGQTVTEIIATAMNNTGHYTLVERSALGKLLSEQAFQLSGLTAGQAAKVGRLAGAQKALVGSLSKLGNVFVIDGKIIDVEKGTIDFSETVKSRSLDDLPEAAREFASKINEKIIIAAGPSPKTHNAAIWRSVAVPGWGQYYSESPTKAKIFFTSWVLGLGAVAVTHNKWQKDRDAYDNSAQTAFVSSLLYQPNLTILTYLQTTDKLNQSIQSSNQLNLAVGFLAGVFITNLVDIYLWGEPPSLEKKPGGKTSFNIGIDRGNTVSQIPGQYYSLGYTYDF